MAHSTARKAARPALSKGLVGLSALLVVGGSLLSLLGCHNDHPYGEEKNVPKNLLQAEQAPPKKAGRGLAMPGP